MIDGRNDVELLCKLFVLKYCFMCYTTCDIFENTHNDFDHTFV